MLHTDRDLVVNPTYLDLPTTDNHPDRYDDPITENVYWKDPENGVEYYLPPELIIEMGLPQVNENITEYKLAFPRGTRRLIRCLFPFTNVNSIIFSNGKFDFSMYQGEVHHIINQSEFSNGDKVKKGLVLGHDQDYNQLICEFINILENSSNYKRDPKMHHILNGVIIPEHYHEFIHCYNGTDALDLKIQRRTMAIVSNIANLSLSFETQHSRIMNNDKSRKEFLRLYPNEDYLRGLYREMNTMKSVVQDIYPDIWSTYIALVNKSKS